MNKIDLPSQLADDLDGAFERLVVAYQDRLYSFALRMLGNPSDAEEVAQDAFARSYRALARYSRERIEALALRPWLYQITLNVVRNRVRGRRLDTVSLVTDEDGEGPVVEDTGAPAPDEEALRSEQARELTRMLSGLPLRYREAVTLRHVDGFSYAEAAALLRQREGTVKANVHRGLKLMRATLDAADGQPRYQDTMRGAS